MTAYVGKLLELAQDPSTHSAMAAFAWLAWRLEKLHRLHARRLVRLERAVFEDHNPASAGAGPNRGGPWLASSMK